MIDPVFVTIDLPALLQAVFIAIPTSLLGTFLFLRREIMLAEGMAHIVLPGLVLGAIVVGAATPAALLGGALVAMLLGGLLIHVLRAFAPIESGAAIGAVYTTLFAGGLVAIEQVGESNNPIFSGENVLYGNLEGTLWLDGESVWQIFDPRMWSTLPPGLQVSAFTTLLVGGVVLLLYKELKIATFDPGHAASLGLNPGLMGIIIMVLTAFTAASAFEAVGSILVLAFFAGPPAAAALLSERLVTRLWLGLGLGVGSSLLGYVAAALGPRLFGLDHSVSAAGTIATFCILTVFLALVVRRLREAAPQPAV